MAWYEGTFSCGHEGRVDIGGPTKDRQRKADWRFSGLCPECYKKYLEEEKERKEQEAAEKSAEMELPELAGTEKQVSWANDLRLKIIGNLTAYLKKLERYMVEKRIEFAPNTDVKIEELHNALDWFMISKTEAKYWIDIRQAGVTFGSIVNEYRAHLDDEIHGDALKEIEEEKEDYTVSPECEERKPGIAEIVFDPEKSMVYAKYIKDSVFIVIVKSLGYRWNGTEWYKEINEYTGGVDDRSAELGNKLLLSGFTVRFPAPGSKEMAVSGTYQPENDRWVKFSKDGQLSLVWVKRSDTLYANAKKLPGARWKDGSMRINVEFYKEVEDFAETMGFSISKKAREEIEKYKRTESGFEKASVTAQNVEKMSDEERIAKSLKSDGTIIEDLIDD